MESGGKMLASRVHADIDLGAIRHNLEAMHDNLKPTTKMIAVVKTNAYGHGAVEVSKAIDDYPFLWGYAVATVEEGIELKEAGRKKNVIVLGMVFPEQYEEIVDYEIRPAICDLDTAKELSKIAVKKNKICNIHIKIDTGMGRIGFQVNKESAKIIAQISKLPNIYIEGMFSHFARADEKDKKYAYNQMGLYNKMVEYLNELSVDIPVKHISNSAGIVEIPDANYDLVRAGITLYGLWPSDEVDRNIIKLEPVMSIKSTVAYVKELDEGSPISYGGTYVTSARRKIATIPVGYGDGYCRGLSNKGYVLIRGQKAPICGRICMDLFMVDVTEIDGVSKGDEVTLLGKDKDLEITMEDLGDMSGRFNYEFACLITSRVPRYYHD